jgi:anti-sigma28 factor (negative regulator of flagellin synthesis)
MHIYGASHLHGPQALQGPHWNRGAAPPAAAQAPDQVDISAAADAAASAAETGGIRADLVARVRSEIAAGVYDTPEKLAIAIDSLLDETA